MFHLREHALPVMCSRALASNMPLPQNNPVQVEGGATAGAVRRVPVARGKLHPS